SYKDAVKRGGNTLGIIVGIFGLSVALATVLFFLYGPYSHKTTVVNVAPANTAQAPAQTATPVPTPTPAPAKTEAPAATREPPSTEAKVDPTDKSSAKSADRAAEPTSRSTRSDPVRSAPAREKKEPAAVAPQPAPAPAPAPKPAPKKKEPASSSA